MCEQPVFVWDWSNPWFPRCQLHGRVRNIDRASYCIICEKDNQNEHNRLQHVRGKAHIVKCKRLFIALQEGDPRIHWGEVVFKRVPASKLVVSDIVIITQSSSAKMVREGLVVGKEQTRGKCRVCIATSTRE